VPRDLGPGQAEDAVARDLEARLLVGVVAAREGRAVVAVTVDLDDEAGFAEEEVDLDALDCRVDQRLRQSVAAEEGEGSVLELAPGGRRAGVDDGREGRGRLAAGGALDLGTEQGVVDDALDLGLVDRALEGAVREQVCEVEEGSSVGDVGGRQGANVMDPDAPPLPDPARDGHVDGSPDDWPQPPQRRRRGVAERRIRPDRENGGDEGALIRQVAVPDRVDTSVERVEPAGLDPVADLGPRNAERMELGGGDDPVLPFGELGKPRVEGCSTFG